MCCQKFWQKIVPFAIAATLGIFVALMFQRFSFCNEIGVNTVPPVTKRHYEVKADYVFRDGTNSINVFSKPRATYTDAARQYNVTGTVRLHVTFLESGQIGDVVPVSSLPHGLTEQAIAAAKNIKFHPATVNGKAITVTKTVEYSFSLY